MQLVRNPLVWLRRISHRRGYGVHSPFAYNFIRGVIYESTPYYAYASLSKLHPWWVRWANFYPLQCRRLLFRLANYAHPSTMAIVGERPVERAYMKAAVPTAEWTRYADFVFVTCEHLAESLEIAAQIPPEGMMVVEGIHTDCCAETVWKTLQADSHTGVTFDLWTYGVVTFDRNRHKQHYVVSF